MKAVEIYRRKDNLAITVPSIRNAAYELGIDRSTVRQRLKDGYATYVNGYPVHVRFASISES